MEDKKPIIYLALDIEGTGARLDAPIVAIGYCLGDEAERIIEKHTFCLKMPPDVGVEENCQKYFWDKHPDLWKRIEREAKPANTVAHQFVDFINELETRFPEESYKIELLSDNPAYDITKLDFFVWNYTRRYPIRYSSTGGYRTISDPSEQGKALPNEDECWEIAVSKCQHDHWPENDAEQIYHLFMQVQKSIPRKQTK